ncbi:MAG: hypothetical protein I3273_06845 [Candidatus Moeniiplasma glomeromycotorum]|nr:hypothetical protein [Candidatus Moeniiplasma glomeromycotorum]MCE8168158.1 hypothetical protein [Candidatus Moeniiplasma glomeromycotorum]MCE8169803.1 hypothetical protein [Candidatus Moeniiplasma glomeromycotorum]
MIENQIDLYNCFGCKKPFKGEQECWALNYQGKAVIHSCLTCWDKHYTTEKFTLAG